MWAEQSSAARRPTRARTRRPRLSLLPYGGRGRSPKFGVRPQSVLFQAGVPGCENCAVFHGDYIKVAYGSDGRANVAWTDMRDPSDVPGLFSQFIYFARK